jgi:hypothetical protein
VNLGAGSHRVTFTFVGYGGYPWLLVLSGAALLGLIALDRRRGGLRRRGEGRAEPGPTDPW